MAKSKEITWTGAEDRTVQACRPCACGCDVRGGGAPGVGYLTGSDADGNGFTVWIEDEAVFNRLASLIGGE